MLYRIELISTLQRLKGDRLPFPLLIDLEQAYSKKIHSRSQKSYL
jgi:hypothetical protein